MVLEVTYQWIRIDEVGSESASSIKLNVSSEYFNKLKIGKSIAGIW
jgi:hypothetical protein